MRMLKSSLMLILLTGFCLPSAFAQRRVSAEELAALSHRKLVLPQSGGDQRQQLQRLRQLQSLWQKNGDSSSANGGGLSQIQKAMAEQMMRQSLKSGNVPKLDELPPDLVSKLLSDPAARSDIQELLQKFQRDGLMPQGNAQGGSRSRPSLPGDSQSQNGRRSVPDSQDRQARVLREPSRDRGDRSSNPRTSSPTDRSTQREDDNRSGRSTSSTGMRPNTAPSGSRTGDAFDGQSPPSGIANGNFLKQQPGESDADYERRISDFLDEQIDRQSAARNDARRPGETGRSDFPGIGRPGESSGLSNGNETNRDSADRNRDGRSSNDGTRNGGTRNGGNGDRADRNRQTFPGGRDSPPADAGDPSGRSGASAEPPVSMSDLLQDLGGLSDEFRQSGPSTNRGGRNADGRNGGSRNSGNGSRSGDANTSDSRDPSSSVADPSANAQLQDAAKRVMKQRGFNAAMREVLSSARQRAADQSARGSRRSDESTGITNRARQAMTNALSGISEEVVELAKNARERRRTDRGSRSGKAGASPSSSGRGSSWLGSVRDSFNDMSRSSASPASTGGGATFAPDSFNGGSFLSLILFLGIVGALAWWLMKSARLQPVREIAPLTRARINAIRTRQDVVDAFHLIALDPGHDTETWWHHEQVRADLITKTPSRKEPLEELTHVYEQARYLPAEMDLNEQQLASAKRAFERCRP